MCDAIDYVINIEKVPEIISTKYPASEAFKYIKKNVDRALEFSENFYTQCKNFLT